MRLARSWLERIGVPESFTSPDQHAPAAELPGGEHYELLVESMRLLLDDFAGAVLDDETALRLSRELRGWSKSLSQKQVPERDQAFGHRTDLPGRGQTMAPTFEMTGRTDDGVEGTVTFGRYFLGGNGATHGGAITLLFDEVLGRLSDTSGRPPGRTAYLNTTFRAVTPVNKRLTVRAWFDSEEGRKRVLRGEIRDGEILCAEAEGLFVALLEGQE